MSGQNPTSIFHTLNTSVFVIAEAGVNHNGDMARARELIDVAAESGADAVKFQTFDAASLVTMSAPKAAYQQALTDPGESQKDMLSKLQLSRDAHWDLMAYAVKRGIRFMSTPFDADSLRFLVSELKLQTLKLSSAEVTNGRMLADAIQSGADVILSTGMSTLEEVTAALELMNSHAETSATDIKGDAANHRWPSLVGKVAVLHCTSQYPAPSYDMNLRAIPTIANATGLPVGLSDHSESVCIPAVAVALGARIIEKHFTLDRTLPGPDHKASLEPDALRHMVDDIRTAEAALGSTEKRCTESETNNRQIVRRSLVAARPIAKGELFGPENVIAKRPGDGLSPMRYHELLGQESDRAYAPDEQIVMP